MLIILLRDLENRSGGMALACLLLCLVLLIMLRWHSRMRLQPLQLKPHLDDRSVPGARPGGVCLTDQADCGPILGSFGVRIVAIRRRRFLLGCYFVSIRLQLWAVGGKRLRCRDKVTTYQLTTLPHSSQRNGYRCQRQYVVTKQSIDTTVWVTSEKVWY